MKLTGGCHCKQVRYEIEGEAVYHALCHCDDCRKHSGAPMVAWALFSENAFTLVQGETKTYQSSKMAQREFCPSCGTGLFYRNDTIFPNMIDIQTGTLDNPSAIPLEMHVQTAERVKWFKDMHSLPEFERFPSAPE